MKHDSLISANGLFHYPLASTTIKSSFLTAIFKPLLLLFLLVMGSSVVWADFVTYTGSEDFYWNSHQKIGGNQWGHIIANDANVWLEFRNTSTSATANTGNGTQADGNVWSDSEPYGIHTAKVPAGTWNQVTVKRGQQGSWSNTGQTFTLETGKNYIGPGDEGLGVYTPCPNAKPSPVMYMAGQGFPNITWNISSISMTWDCDNAIYYHTFSNLTADNSHTYRFKLNPTSDNWNSQLNSNAIDNAHEGANITLESIDDSRITFNLAQNSDVTIYTNGTKVWAATPASEPAALNCRLMGDFWLKADNGWLGTDKGPQFIDNGDGTATISYLVNTQAPRFTFVKDGSETSENKWDDTHSTSV